MINIIKKEIDVEELLRKRLEIICDFRNNTPTIINGNEEDTFEDLQDTYEFSKNHDYERDKDDFEMEI